MSLGVIDVGTTNVKLIIYDEELNQRYSETVNVPMTFPGNYRVEQDANALRSAFNHLISTARDKGVKYLASQPIERQYLHGIGPVIP